MSSRQALLCCALSAALSSHIEADSSLVVERNECPSKMLKYNFIIGTDLHHVEFGDGLEDFLVDGHKYTKNGEAEPESKWSDVAKPCLSSLGVSDETSVQALALEMSKLESAARETLNLSCREHFQHGGMGILGKEDIESLLADACCNAVQDELLDFYVGPDFTF